MADKFNPTKARADFLIAMYNQLMGDINRHIVVVWQSVATLIGAFAAWSLVEKQIISLDIAVTLIVGISVWVLAHVYDAAYWYNRNLVMIANIERQFLRQSDLKEIHYYWGEHRSKTSMLTHLRLQRALALGVAGLVLCIHFVKIVIPIIACTQLLELLNILPWLAAIMGLYIWRQSFRRGVERYAEFLENSPGKAVNTKGVHYGVGHPTDNK